VPNKNNYPTLIGPTNVTKLCCESVCMNSILLVRVTGFCWSGNWHSDSARLAREKPKTNKMNTSSQLRAAHDKSRVIPVQAGTGPLTMNLATVATYMQLDHFDKHIANRVRVGHHSFARTAYQSGCWDRNLHGGASGGVGGKSPSPPENK